MASPSTPPPSISLAHLPAAALLLELDDLTVADINAEALELFGSRREEVVGRLLTALVAQPAALLEALSDDAARPVLLEGRRRNGVPFMVEVRARALPGPASPVALCVVRESDRDAVQRAADRFFDAAFAHSPIGMALYNTDGEFVRANPALCAMLDRTELALIGTRDQLLTHPDDRQRDVDAAWRILNGELDTFETEKRFLRRDGSIVWVSANLTFLRDEQRRPIAWLGQFQDITERRHHEERLRRLTGRAD